MDARPAWFRRIGGTLLATLVTTLAAAAPAPAAPGWAPAFEAGFDATSVAMAPDGTTAYAGIATVSGAPRAAVQVRPPGGPLEPVQLLSAPGLGGASRTAVAANADGTFVAAWAQAGVLTTAFKPPSSSEFSDLADMPAPGEQAVGSVAVALADNGGAHVLWTSNKTVIGGTQKLLRAGVRPATGSPSSQIQETGNTASGTTNTQFFNLQIDASDAGAAIAGWLRNDTSNDDRSSYARAAMHAPGQPFGAPILLENGQASDSSPSATHVDGPHVAITPSGTTAAAAWVYRSYTPSTDVRLVRFRTGGPGAGLGGVLVPSIGGGLFPTDAALALAPDGRPLVGFRAQVAGVYRAQVATTAPGGGSFAPPKTVVAAGDMASKISLAASASGTDLALVTTYSNTTGKSSVRGVAAPAGGSFGPPSPLADGLNSLVDQSLTTTPAGDGVAIWRHFKATGYGSDAAGYDVSGPVLHDVQIPGAAVAGEPIGFSVRPVDIWSQVASTSWAFGDGSAAALGQSVSHSFAAAGSPAVAVTSRDALGNETSRSGAVAVAPAPTAAPPPTPPPGPETSVAADRDRKKPSISGFTISRSVFAAAKRRARAAAKRRTTRVRRGATFRLRMSEAAAAKISFRRETSGLRSGRRCVGSTSARRRALLRSGGRKHLAKARCVRLVEAGFVRRKLRAGRNSFKFDGWVGRRPLRRARYRARITATDAAGNRGSRSGPRFRISRAR